MQYSLARTVLIAVLVAGLAGCGLIADKDQIVVAHLDGKPVTRGDLKRALRGMEDDERPVIANRGDLERYLRDYVDKQIADSLRVELENDKKIEVPREQAAAAYFAEHPDQKMIPTLTDPTPMGVSEEQLASLKAEIEYQIDRVQDKMLRERAVQYTASEAFKAGLLTISDEEYAREYSIQKENLKSMEYIDFIGLRFPATMEGSVTAASDVRRRVDAGESFDAIVSQVLQRDPKYVLRSRFENNPNSASFRTFWMTATGAEIGQVIGPVFIPAYSLVNSEGQQVQMPDAYLVLKVEDHKPPTDLTLEEAKPYLAQFILLRKATQMLREQHGVDFIDKNLWDPGGLGQQEMNI